MEYTCFSHAFLINFNFTVVFLYISLNASMFCQNSKNSYHRATYQSVIDCWLPDVMHEMHCLEALVLLVWIWCLRRTEKGMCSALCQQLKPFQLLGNRDYITMSEWPNTRLRLMIEFIEYLLLLTTDNYNTSATLHNLQITTAYFKAFQSVIYSCTCRLFMASSNRDCP
jgi:hypothetical protein